MSKLKVDRCAGPQNADAAMLAALNGGIPPSLIAAAPDLLEAARFAVRDMPLTLVAREYLIAAIAKAEGRGPLV